MICDSCNYKRNCINGRWCLKLKRYVEYSKDIKACEEYKE